MVKIEKVYDTYEVTEPDGNVLKYDTLEDMMYYMKTRVDNYQEESVEATTFAYDDESIVDATDVLILAVLASWGKQLYSGDSIKLTIKAEYCPENK